MRSGGAAHKNMEAPRNIEMNLKRVPPWRRGRPKAGIDCPEGAELCRMVKRTYGITGKRSETNEVNPTTMDCASSRHSILRLWRGPSPRAYSRGLSHMGFHSAAASCASSRHSILRFWRGPSPRAYSRGIISHGLSCRCGKLCLFEALYPAPLARLFSKGLLAGGIF